MMNNVKRNIVLAGMLAVLVPVQVDAGLWNIFTNTVWNPIKNNKTALTNIVILAAIGGVCSQNTH